MAENGNTNEATSQPVESKIQDEETHNGVQQSSKDVEKVEIPHDHIVAPNYEETGTSQANGKGRAETEKTEEQPKPSKLKNLWGKLGLDTITLILMLKGSLPPLIGVAFYQAPSVAATYVSLGYLVPISSILCVTILPRAKFIQVLILNVLGTCVASAVSMLGIWSGIEARNHTSEGTTTAGYNSSQAAVCAIWLFANLWISNLLRAKFPALQFTSIVYTILISVALTYGSRYQTIAQAEAFQKQLLGAFLTGFALSTGVALFVFPISSRKVVFGEITKYLGAVQGTIKAQSAYLQSLEKSDMFSQSESGNAAGKEEHKINHANKEKTKQEESGNQAEAKALKAAVTGITGLHGVLHGDIAYAKREFAYGKLGPDDLDEIFGLLQGIMIPLIGMSTITDIFERIAERRGWIEARQKSHFDEEEAWDRDPSPESRAKDKRLWNDIMKELHEPFAIISQAMDEGMEHVGVLLELTKPQKAKKGVSTEADVEAKGDDVKPGDSGFSEYLQNKVTTFYASRGQTVKKWAREKGLSAEDWDAARSPGLDGSEITPEELQHHRDQQQLYLILYMEFLLYSTGTAILKLIQFAEKKVADGSMKKSRFIHPGPDRIRKWLTSLGTEDSAADSSTPDSMAGASTTIYMGAGFGKRKHPEHLPPASLWEKFGNGIRTVPHFLASEESTFGFRVALATMTIGIVSFLENSQIFFFEQRLVWAMIMTAIGMSVTTGQSVFGFFVRIGGTVIAMVSSIVIWYIVDQKPPGVIVFLWLSIFIQFYLFLKFPRFVQAWIIAIVTQILIVDYQLQVDVIGIPRATATGQPYYPIYELAPYRLATVAGGCFVGFFWTVFPYPLTDRTWLRKDLGASIYLLANYYSIVHSTIGARLRRTEGNMDDENSPGRQLERVRHKVFGKLLLLLPSLHDHTDWQKWEPTLGGKFPTATYESIIQRLRNLMNYMALISYTAQSFSERPASEHAWLTDLSRLLASIKPTSHAVTSTLVLLSASIKEGSALPPYMQLPRPYELSRKLEQLDSGILSSKHIEEPGYSAYAVLQVASSMVTDDLKRLVEDVKTLVGEVDFSFRVESVDDDGEEVDGKGKVD